MKTMKQHVLACATNVLHDAGDDGFTRDFQFGDDFPGFAGHFPGMPILPAFLQLLTAVTVIEEERGTRLLLKQVKSAKFLARIKPNDTVTVCCKEVQSEEGLRYGVVLSAAEQTASKFTMILEQEANTNDQ